MKTTEIIKILKRLDLDDFDIISATSSFKRAESAAEGIFWHKLKGRIWNAPKIAKKLKWEDNRILYVDESLKDYDIAPMKNITCNGDNAPWIEGIGPVEDVWLSKDKDSEEYKQAVASCYWSKGNHPRSYEARKDWYRRNSGEFKVYALGERINPMHHIRVFKLQEDNLVATFYNTGVVWQCIIEKKIFGRFWLKIRQGFEIDNVMRGDGVQLWYPIPNYELKAPVTKSSIPFWRKNVKT